MSFLSVIKKITLHKAVFIIARLPIKVAYMSALETCILPKILCLTGNLPERLGRTSTRSV